MSAGVGVGMGAMSSLLGKLSDLLVGEYKLLKGVRKQVEFLQRELGSMHALLETLADMEKLDPLAKDWKGKIRDLTYDLEDCVDRFIDRLGDGDAKRGFMKKTARRLRTLWARHDIATQIKELKARVVEESERRDRHKLDESCKPPRTVEIDPRLPTFYEKAKILVAIDAQMEHVISWLMNEELKLKVMAIVGSGGLGKTTLAMEVYRKIGESFQCRASISVSRTLDLDKLLKDVLSQIDKDHYSRCQSERWEKEQLIHELRQILTTKRYFIVIDDVWREQDWKFIKAAFPENNNSSRIVTTTRITSVAKSCCSNSDDQLYEMAPLDDFDSRRLFCKRIFCSDNSCPPQLEKVSVKILKKCGGLPLAIITMASLLASKPQNKDEWESLQASIGSDSSLQKDENLKRVDDILLLSYWDLPHHLKTCLLYLSLYPEDYHIQCKELKLKWIAEGFIATQWGDLNQAAENCLTELVNRSMIQPVHVDYDGRIKYCRIHDMVLDLIISLSNEENFATVLNGRVCNSLPSKIHRLSVQSSIHDRKRISHAITKCKLHVRSLNIFLTFGQIPTLVDFHALRVLDFHGQQSLQNKQDIKNIGSLSQLRYLRIAGFSITVIPDEIGNLRHLETLDLGRCMFVRRMPSTLVRLRKLERLFVHRDIELPVDEFGSMESLEEVSTIRRCGNRVKFAEELAHLTNLRKLSITICLAPRWIPRDDAEETFLKLLGSSISKLCKENLGFLHTSGPIGDYIFSDNSGYTFPNLQDLHIWTPHSARVPNGMASLENLVKLVIHVYRFDEDDLNILMVMPSLAHLQLMVYYDQAVDVNGKLATVSSNGFKHLKVFRFKNSPGHGMGIAFAPGSMRALELLHLCLRAKQVIMSRYWGGANLGLEHLSVLAHLRLETDCSGANIGQVEAVEGFVQEAIALHPNRHSLQVRVSRLFESDMSKDYKEKMNDEDIFIARSNYDPWEPQDYGYDFDVFR